VTVAVQKKAGAGSASPGPRGLGPQAISDVGTTSLTLSQNHMARRPQQKAREEQEYNKHLGSLLLRCRLLHPFQRERSPALWAGRPRNRNGDPNECGTSRGTARSGRGEFDPVSPPRHPVVILPPRDAIETSSALTRAPAPADPPADSRSPSANLPAGKCQ
jgi:hypothetical protein